MLAQHIIRTRIIFVCWPHTNSYIMAVKYYEFVCLPHTNSYGREILWIHIICFQCYEFNTTNSYVTNQKKLAIEKTYEFVWNSVCIRKKKTPKYKKRDSSLSPGMRESVNLLPKYFRHQPKKGDGTIFYRKITKKTIWKKRSYESAFSQPLLGRVHRLVSWSHKIIKSYLSRPKKSRKYATPSTGTKVKIT
jgi:hypothetical protein